MNAAELARRIDHTALRPEVTADDVRRLCDEARALGVAAACVAPVWIPLAASTLAGSRVRLAAVIGFPHGDATSAGKADEARRALDAGAEELDMVMAIGRLKSGEAAAVERDIAGVVGEARRSPGAVVKVILETAVLSDAEKVLACRLAESAGADFVKTSTGFAAAGATVEDVRLLFRTVGDRLGVKASGGIRTLDSALALLDAGASRLGTSSTAAILGELARRRSARIE